MFQVRKRHCHSASDHLMFYPQEGKSWPSKRIALYQELGAIAKMELWLESRPVTLEATLLRDDKA